MIILQSSRVRMRCARSLRSPSCGVKQRYDGTFSGKLVDKLGVTAQLLLDSGFTCIDVEDI